MRPIGRLACPLGLSTGITRSRRAAAELLLKRCLARVSRDTGCIDRQMHLTRAPRGGPKRGRRGLLPTHEGHDAQYQWVSSRRPCESSVGTSEKRATAAFRGSAHVRPQAATVRDKPSPGRPGPPFALVRPVRPFFRHGAQRLARLLGPSRHRPSVELIGLTTEH